MAYVKAMRRMYMKLGEVNGLVKQVMMTYGEKMKKMTFGERKTKLRRNTS